MTDIKDTNDTWTIQFSPKNPNGTLANIRGRTREEFTQALDIFKEFGPIFGFAPLGNQALSDNGTRQFIQPTVEVTNHQQQTPPEWPVPAPAYTPPPNLANQAMTTRVLGPSQDANHPIVVVRGVSTKTGETNGKRWSKLILNSDHGDFDIGFDKSIAEILRKATGAAVQLTLEQKGKFTNIVGVTLA